MSNTRPDPLQHVKTHQYKTFGTKIIKIARLSNGNLLIRHTADSIINRNQLDVYDPIEYKNIQSFKNFKFGTSEILPLQNGEVLFRDHLTIRRIALSHEEKPIIHQTFEIKPAVYIHDMVLLDKNDGEVEKFIVFGIYNKKVYYGAWDINGNKLCDTIARSIKEKFKLRNLKPREKAVKIFSEAKIINKDFMSFDHYGIPNLHSLWENTEKFKNIQHTIYNADVQVSEKNGYVRLGDNYKLLSNGIVVMRHTDASLVEYLSCWNALTGDKLFVSPLKNLPHNAHRCYIPQYLYSPDGLIFNASGNTLHIYKNQLIEGEKNIFEPVLSEFFPKVISQIILDYAPPKPDLYNPRLFTATSSHSSASNAPQNKATDPK